MTSIRREFIVDTPPAAVWDAVVDFGALHTRLAAGFVVDTVLDGGDRLVTFVNGAQARERLIAVDHEHRRLVYSVVESAFALTHHQSSVDVVAEGGRANQTRVVWITDMLPDDHELNVAGMMDAGVSAMTRSLTASSAFG